MPRSQAQLLLSPRSKTRRNAEGHGRPSRISKPTFSGAYDEIARNEHFWRAERSAHETAHAPSVCGEILRIDVRMSSSVGSLSGAGLRREQRQEHFCQQGHGRPGDVRDARGGRTDAPIRSRATPREHRANDRGRVLGPRAEGRTDLSLLRGSRRAPSSHSPAETLGSGEQGLGAKWPPALRGLSPRLASPHAGDPTRSTSGRRVRLCLRAHDDGLGRPQLPRHDHRHSSSRCAVAPAPPTEEGS
jgi:hypothetical protein